MVARRTLVVLAVVTVLAVAAVRTRVVVGNYTLAKEEMKHQYKAHAEESVECTKEYLRSCTGWLVNRVKQGLGFKPTPYSHPDLPINHGDDDDDEHRPGKAKEIKTMASAGELKDTPSTDKKAREAATNMAEDAHDKAKQGYETAEKKTQETLDSAKEKYDDATKKVNEARDCLSNGGKCKDEL